MPRLRGTHLRRVGAGDLRFAPRRTDPDPCHRRRTHRRRTAPSPDEGPRSDRRRPAHGPDAVAGPGAAAPAPVPVRRWRGPFGRRHRAVEDPRPPGLEHLRAHRDGRRRHHAALRGTLRGAHPADRPADRQPPCLRRGQAAPPRPAGPPRRTVHRRHGRRPWLPGQPRAHVRTFRRRPLGPAAGRADVPHRRPRPLEPGRRTGVPRPRRPASEDQRAPDRTGRDRGRTPPPSAGRTGRRPGPRPSLGRQGPDRVPGCRRRRGGVDRGHPAASGAGPAPVHGPGPPGGPGPAAPHPQREARPRGPGSELGTIHPGGTPAP